MARGGKVTGKSPRWIWQSTAIVAMVAVIAGVAILAEGFNVQEVPVNSSSVWVMQNGSGQRYGQVNTSIKELDGAYPVGEPTSLVQSESNLYVYAEGNSSVAAVTTGQPTDLVENRNSFVKTPAQTDVVASAGGVVAYLSADGTARVSTVTADGPLSDPFQVTTSPSGPSTTESSVVFRAVTVSVSGLVYLYSPNDNGKSTIRTFDPAKGTVSGPTDVTEGPETGELQLSTVGDKWILLKQATREVWTAGQAPVTFGQDLGANAVLQVPGPSRDVAYLATESGLVSVSLTGDPAPTRVFTSNGTPARPRDFAGHVYGSWLPGGGTEGVIYDASNSESTTLDFNGQTLPQDVSPVFQANENAMVLNETGTGWTWTVPEGELILSSQDWSLTDLTPDRTSDQAEVTDITSPKKPVAEADGFGVRAGQLVTLPVLLNDHDANNDLLTIIPSQVGGLDGAFGSVAVANNSQSLVLNVPAGASGQTSFSYAVTDGTSADGLNSDPTSVQINVIPADANSAPVWCGDLPIGCVQKWPNVQVASQGSVTVPFLTGWVDPEGDQFFVDSVINESGLGQAGVSPDGTISFRAPNVTEVTTVNLKVRVIDVLGASTERTLAVTVSPEPQLTVTPFVVTTSVGERVTVDVAPHVSGFTESPSITQLETTTPSQDVELSTTAPTEFTFVSQTAGEFYISLTVTSKDESATSKVRVSVVPAESAGVTTSPVSVFLTPNSDTVIDVLSATMNPSGRALLTTNIELHPSEDPASGQRAALFADPIDQGRIRVRGSTSSGLAGFIGRVTYTVSDGSGEARYTAAGEASVYLLPPPASQAPVGIDDQVVVRAGGQVDVDVLANDAGPAGSVLDLAPDSVNCGAVEGAIIFASNNQMRVLAPTVAGTVTCSYSLFVRGSPSVTAQAKLVVTVKDSSSNRAPQPPTLTGQVTDGGNVSIPLDFSRMDPDGDAVNLVDLGIPDAGGFASVSSDRSSIVYSSRSGATGQDSFTYTVKDALGETGEGTVRIAITSDKPDPGPVTLSDYVEVATGADAKAVISPTGNDFDPLREGLEIVDVTPNRASVDDPLYKEWKTHIVEMTKTQVTFSGTADPSTMEFVYTVKDADGNVATGTIVVKVTDTGAATYPVISDTYLSFEQISQLPSGIDVLANHVSWSSGSVEALTLSIERSKGSYSASGNKISGNAPLDGDLVTFKVQGKDFAGSDVVTYGFMHVPSQKDALLSLDPNAVRQTVNEGESKTWSLSELLKLPAGMNVEVDTGNIESLGDREQGECTSAGGTSFTYSAGKGKPWEDGCVVPARLAGSDSYTRLLVPISVIPVNPEPELASRKLTISPGKLGTQEFDLRKMTTWPGKTQADIDGLSYEYSYDGEDFEISQKNQILTITAKAQSAPGTKADVMVSILGHPDTEPAPLVLVVGEQLNGGPVGGSITKTCQSNTGSCTISKSEMRGAYDPWSPGNNPNFAPFGYRGGSPEYDREDNVMMCGSVRLTATENSIEATWDAGAKVQGVNCPNITYLVLDQNEQNGSGTLNFTLEGPPAAPGAVRQSGYTDNSVTLTISPGQAGQAAPRLESYEIYMDDEFALSCDVAVGRESVDRECEINGLNPYDGTNEADNHTFRVTAKNAIGESASAATVASAYAYRAPLAITPDIVESAETIFDPAITTDARGAVKMTINPVADNLVTQYKIQGDGQAATYHPVDGSTFTVNNVAANVGERSNIVITALGRVPPPTSDGQDSSTTWTVRVAGSPTVGSLVVQGTPVQSSGAETFEVDVTVTVSNRNYSLNTGSFVVALWPSGSIEPTCIDQVNDANDPRSPAPVGVDGAPSTISSTPTREGSDQDSVRSWTASVHMEGLASQQSYNSKVCYSNAFGTRSLGGSVVSTLADPNSGDFTWAVNRAPVGGAWLAKIVSSTTPAGLRAEFTMDPPSSGASRTWWQNDLQDSTFGNPNPTYYVRYCTTTGASCSPGATEVGYADPQRMQQMKITGATLGNTCTFGYGLQFEAQGSGLTAGGAPAWRVSSVDATGAAYVPAEYSTNGGASFTPMVVSGSNWAVPDDQSLPNGASIVIRVYMQGNPDGGGPTAGLTGLHTVTLSPVTCNYE